MQIDESRLAEAVREERERKRKGRDEEEDKWGKKQKKKGDTAEVTEEELGAFRFSICIRCVFADYRAEAYRMNRRMTEDPMANYVDPEL